MLMVPPVLSAGLAHAGTTTSISTNVSVTNADDTVLCCRFTGKFKKKLVRASIDVLADGRTVAVAPAQ
jgi:hypothetical protein